MTLEELRERAAEAGAFVIEKEDGVHVMSVNPTFDVLWRDGRFYTLDGRPVEDMLYQTFAELEPIIRRLLEGVVASVNQIGVQLNGMLKPAILYANRELRLVYSHKEGRWIPRPDYRIERKRRRIALRKKRNRG